MVKNDFVILMELKYKKNNIHTMDSIRDRNYCDVFTAREIIKDPVRETDRISIMEAELSAIRLAISVARSLHPTKFLLFSDSRSALDSVARMGLCPDWSS